MNWNEYLIQSKRTMEDKGKQLNLLHFSMGVSTEANEILDVMKKNIFYGKEVDIVNVKEKIGDIFWYIAIACRELNLDLESILDLNINKLKTRYPDKFTQEKALNRNLEAERLVLNQEGNK